MNTPRLIMILPHLIVPAALAFALLLWARRRGASWPQMLWSFAAATLGAFMTAGGWVTTRYFAGEPLSFIKVLGSQVLVGGACGMLVFFGLMPPERDVTNERDRGDDQMAPGGDSPR